MVSDGTQITYEYYDGTGTTGVEGRLAAITTPDGRRSEFDYNSDGLLSETREDYNPVTPAWRRITTYDYDTRGNLTYVEAPDGTETYTDFNDFGQPLHAWVSHLGNYPTTSLATQTHTYSDSLSTSDPQYAVPPSLISSADFDGNETDYLYNSMGQETEVTDRDGHESTYAYDARGRQVEERRLMANLSSSSDDEFRTFAYDLYDNMVKFTDERGKSTRYWHDEFGRRVREVDPDGYYTELTYGSAVVASCGCGGSGGKIERIRRQDGATVRLTYDLSGNPTAIDYENIGATNSNELAFYYIGPHLQSVVDNRLTVAGSGEYYFDYDTGIAPKTGRLNFIRHPEGYTQEYVYNDDPDAVNLGKLAAYKDVDGNIQTYEYDSLGRLSTLSDQFGGDTVSSYATTGDTSYPIGAVKRLQYGNGTKNDHSYDDLGRPERIDYLPASGAAFDYIELAHDPAGMIIDRERKDSSSHFTTHYDYDAAYRLTEETNKNSSGTPNSGFVYTYDAAGNRQTMNQWNDASVNKTTTYSYGDREQLVSDDGYYASGTTDTGSHAYEFDVKGNMTRQSGKSFEWNEDDRLVHAWVSGGDPKAELFQKFYGYDYGGRRILEHLSTSPSQRKRFFFNGLTEEVTKVSVGTHADTSFGRIVRVAGDDDEELGGSASILEYDPATEDEAFERRSKVWDIYGEAGAGRQFWETTGWSYADTTNKTVAFWAKTNHTNSWVCIDVVANDGSRYGISYYGGTGSIYSVSSGTFLFIPLGGGSQSIYGSNYVRVERNLNADLQLFYPTKTVATVTGVYLWSEGHMWLDDLSFSNSMTVEKNILGGGSVAQILRNRITNPSDYTLLDRWFHYDQVGSVIAESDSSGANVETHHQNGFGNTLLAWETGIAGGDSNGWHHNTKEYDMDTHLVYMYQRWYSPEQGVFLSSAPAEAYLESRFGFATNYPIGLADPEGRFSTKNCGCLGVPDASADDWFSVYSTRGSGTEKCLAKVSTWDYSQRSSVVTEECMEKMCRSGDVKCENCGVTNLAGRNSPWWRDSDGLFGYDAIVCKDHPRVFWGKGITFLDVVLHEFAHQCGWDANHENDPVGVPYPDPNIGHM